MSTGLGSVVFIPYPSVGELYAAAIVLPLVGLATISLRYYVRYTRKVALGVDDWLLIPALLAVIGMGICMLIAISKKAMGYPSPTPDLSNMDAFLNDLDPVTAISERIDFSITILMILAYCFIKLSIAFLYRRIFVVSSHSSKTFNIITWLLIAIIISWTITFVFLSIFTCGSHVSAQWGSRSQLALYCGEGSKHQEALYVSEFITNILLLLAPIVPITRLRLKTSLKIQVFGILLLAFAAFAASIVRLILVIETVHATFTQSFDIDQTNSTLFYWAMIEAGIALIACCLPVLKPLVSDKGIGSVVASVRSRVTLGSNHSNLSQDSKIRHRGSEREGSIAAPLKEEDIEMHNLSSRGPSGEHAV